MVERELLGAGMQLDAPRTRVQSPSCLRDRVLIRRRRDPAERDQHAGPIRRCAEDHVVGRRVPVGLVHGARERPPRTRAVKAVEQLPWRLLHPVGIVAPEVGVGIEELDPGNELADVV